MKKLLQLSVSFIFSLSITSVIAAERVYYIAAVEVDWNYIPDYYDHMMGMPIMENQEIFVKSTDTWIGGTYRKAVYREYTDDSFTTQKTRGEAEQHLGIMGPTIHAEVGDTIKLVFKNMATLPYSVHPHGVFYTKSSEGAPYADGTSGKDKADDIVQPGMTHTYEWKVPERAGPAENDPSSIAWLYHSHVKEIADTNAGLIGTIIITRKGMADKDGRPKDVDREFVNLYTVMNENESHYLDYNIDHFANREKVDAALATHEGAEEFEESNLMHTINGYVFANLPGLKMNKCDRVRWYTVSMGTEVDLHTPHWHGNTGVFSGRRVDVVNLMPATSKTVDMITDNPGTWMYHCHVNDHLSAGMTALYEVIDNNKSCQ